MSRRTKIWGRVFGVTLAVWMVLGYGVSQFITRPRNCEIRPREEIAGTKVEPVTFTAEDGVKLSAWLVRGKPDRVVVLAAGIDGDRGSLVGRAEFYLARGFSVLLPDLRGTGESEPTLVTIGWEERKDILACLKFLKERGYEHVGADGISLGASAIAYSMEAKPDFAFVVLESCYDNLDNAWRNRLAMFSVPHAITWPVRWITEARLGRTAFQLAPAEYMKHCEVPALIVAGDSEPELKTSETDTIFKQCASKEKQLYLFQGGKHQDFLSRFEQEYHEVVGGFVDKIAAGWETASVTVATR